MEIKKRALGKGLEQLFNNENLELNTLEQTVYETESKEKKCEISENELRQNNYQDKINEAILNGIIKFLNN